MDLEKILATRIYFKIITFFHENPMSIDTPRGISTWIGENKQLVKDALLALSTRKILTAHMVTSTTGYSYTRDEKMIKKIDTLLRQIKGGNR
ncbi:MAG: hypothetical protein WCG78_02030 [Candidatus Omnitrophota bacterium]